MVSELLADRLPLHDERVEDVLTLEEVAALLRVPTEDVLAQVRAGDLPGRRLGDEWRFVRSAVLAWLAGVTPEAFGAQKSDPDGR